MKNIAYFILALTIFLAACKKNNNDGWSEEDQASYNKVIELQKQAAKNYDTWMQNMDSLEVINQLQQFFLDDPAVASATISKQGIMVEYKNGLGGGILLNPLDNPEFDTLHPKTFAKKGNPALKNQPEVNKKEAILLNPHYWDRLEWTDQLISTYNKFLPMAGYSLSRTYFNDEADVDQFTKLSGYGIIHIYTHGLWCEPKKDVYIMTGEEENRETSEKYWAELRRQEILIVQAKTSEFGSDNVYFLSKKFVADHNDFSQDTVLFYGGFCYSSLGYWGELPNSCAAGTYVGFDWSVYTSNCTYWAQDLIKTMADTTPGQPSSILNWLGSSTIVKNYWDEEDKRTVSVQVYGDTLFLWKKPIFIGQSYGGGIIFYIDATKQHGLICAPSDYQPYWPYLAWGGLGKLVGTGTAIGAGEINTFNIVMTIGNENAAGVCNDLVLNGYSDWFLPSKDELNEMFKQRNIVGANAKFYWSSSECEDDPSFAAWIQHFSYAPFGNQNGDYKSYNYYATRAVRAF